MSDLRASPGHGTVVYLSGINERFARALEDATGLADCLRTVASVYHFRIRSKYADRG